jgi:hypothetical protein
MEPMAKAKSSPTLDFDSGDPSYKALFGFSGRIGKLLNVPAVQGNADLAGSLDDFLGAVYALIQTKHHHFADREGRPIDIKHVAQRAAQIAKGRVRTTGQWIAGFYFNNALFRTAAVYDRVLKIVVGKAAKVDKLRREAQILYPHWTCSKLGLVNSQVNDLKHTPRGVHDQRTVTYDDCVAAIGELLDLIDAWIAANVPSTPKS